VLPSATLREKTLRWKSRVAVRAIISSAWGVETSGGIRSINMGARIQEQKYYAPSGRIQRGERMRIPTLGGTYILISNYPVACVRRYLQWSRAWLHSTCQRDRTGVPVGSTDEWTGAGASGAVDRKPSGASDKKVSGAEPAGRAKATGEAARAGVPLTVTQNGLQILTVLWCSAKVGLMGCVSTEQIPGSEVTKATEARRVPKRISLEFRLE
jgi:hypothetical protein